MKTPWKKTPVGRAVIRAHNDWYRTSVKTRKAVESLRLLRDCGIGLESTYDDISKSEVVDLLNDAISKLKPKEIELLGMVYCEGRTLAEVGRAWGCSRQYTTAMESAALKKLKSALVKKGVK